MMGHMVSKMYESVFDPLSPQSRSPFFSIYFLIYLELHTQDAPFLRIAFLLILYPCGLNSSSQ